MAAVVNGLVLSGGKSLRMGRDKGSLIYPPRAVNQRTRCYELLARVCEKIFISIREDQKEMVHPSLPTILDSVLGEGPGVGILSAHAFDPEAAWFVLACDFPFAQESDIDFLFKARDSEFAATTFTHDKGTVEPLFSIWEPSALQIFSEAFKGGQMSPRQTLMRTQIKSIQALNENTLMNVNSARI
jgi:molybdopterin-guanine dinucleotide biosynthesis protein A